MIYGAIFVMSYFLWPWFRLLVVVPFKDLPWISVMDGV